MKGFPSPASPCSDGEPMKSTQAGQEDYSPLLLLLPKNWYSKASDPGDSIQPSCLDLHEFI